MLIRKISHQLHSWFLKPSRFPVLIEGARQVGKTYIIRQFAKEHYPEDAVLSVNLELQSDVATIFDGSLDVDSIIGQLRFKFPQIDWNQPRLLLFFDEIQVQPRAITALKSFAEDGRYDVIVSGSLLGIAYRLVSSFPVRYVERITLHSLDFEEFLWAMGVDAQTIKSLYSLALEGSEAPPLIHREMMKHFVNYIVVGGMPEVVEHYSNHKDYHEVLLLQQRILADYRTDIAKYADGSEKLKVRQCFDSIPQQLAKDYKKFQYTTVEKRSNKQKYGNSVDWLVDAGIVHKCYNVSTPQIPYVGFKREDSFKLYLHDTGLLVALLGESAQRLVLSGELGFYKGALYENMYAQLLVSRHIDLFYYEKNSTLEIDFLVTRNTDSTGVEVKASSGRSKSLSSAIEHHGVHLGVKCTAQAHIKRATISHYPHYLFFFIHDIS